MPVTESMLMVITGKLMEKVLVILVDKSILLLDSIGERCGTNNTSSKVSARGMSFMERVKGVEPSSPVWKTGALTVELHPHIAIVLDLVTSATVFRMMTLTKYLLFPLVAQIRIYLIRLLHHITNLPP